MQLRRLGLALALAVGVPGAVCAQRASADPAAWLEAPGASAELVPEPVFGGRVMLYHAGRREGPAVVLIHGLGQNGARDWGKLIPVLAEGYAIYALDLPGFGQSDKGNHLYSPATFARVIEAVLGPRVGRPFVLIGHSMGGAVSLAYAAAYPDRIDRLILVDVAGVLHRAVYSQFLSRLGAAAIGVSPEEAPWFGALTRAVLTRMEIFPQGAELVLNIAPLRERVLRGDPNTIAAYALVDHDFSEALRAIKAPTLVIWGRDDQIAPLRTGQMAAALIPGARLAVIDRSTHTPMLQAPERFSAVVLDELGGRLAIPPFAPHKLAAVDAGIAQCDREHGRQFSGSYRELRLNGCADVQISHARIGLLAATDSSARILDSEIREGVNATGSTLEFTAGSVASAAGRPPLALDASSVDAAGTRFESEGAIAENRGPVPLTLFLSVAETVRAGKASYAHEVVRLARRARW